MCELYSIQCMPRTVNMCGQCSWQVCCRNPCCPSHAALRMPKVQAQLHRFVSQPVQSCSFFCSVAVVAHSWRIPARIDPIGRSFCSCTCVITLLWCGGKEGAEELKWQETSGMTRTTVRQGVAFESRQHQFCGAA